MKKFFLSIIIAAGGLLSQTASAQVGVNVGVRIGPLVINVHKPVPPAVVYDNYYYLPDVEAYYSVPEHCYYYMDDDRRWVSGAYLPGRYHDYDWRSARRYEVRAQRPYANHDYYRSRYGSNGGRSWNNNQYANRTPDRRDDRGYNGRFPSSPYDSNNAGGGRGNWDRNNRNEDRSRDRDRNYGQGPNEGGNSNNNNGYPNRSGYPNRENNGQPGRDNNQGNYGRPSNGGFNRENNQNGNSNNRNGNYQQRYTQNNGGSSRPQLPGNRYSF
ncbi:MULTISPECIES: hypothetical protein [unclassified Mucilaginibacter]|uniref:hypothetical protein n=1 Tax=unclassified Mucilaginibacter TaxID=2617802 RepID=UPI0031F5F223